MAAAGNYSGSEAEKFLTVVLGIFSSPLPISSLRMGPITVEYGILFKDIPEICCLEVCVIPLR